MDRSQHPWPFPLQFTKTEHTSTLFKHLDLNAYSANILREYAPQVPYRFREVYEKDFLADIPQNAIFVNYHTLVQCPQCGRWKRVLFPSPWDEGPCRKCRKKRCIYCKRDRTYFGDPNYKKHGFCSKECEMRAKHGPEVTTIIQLRRDAIKKARNDTTQLTHANACKTVSCDISVALLEKIAKQAHLPREVITTAIQYLRGLEKAFAKTLHCPRTAGKVGTALYLATFKHPPILSQTEAAKLAGTSATTLRKYAQILRKKIIEAP